MTLRTLILRSLRFHWRSHLGVVLGAAVGSAALVGALVVGDSVKLTLRERALQRLGWVDVAMAPSDRFFTQATVSNAAVQLRPQGPYLFSAALRLPGTAARQDGAARANRIQVIGVQSNFWNADANPGLRELPSRSVVLNEALAAQLRAKPGDELILRIHKPSALSRDVPISPRSDASVALRVRVHAVAGADDLGDFNLHAGQGPTLNAFVPLADLDAAAGLPGRANLFLAGMDRRQLRSSAEALLSQFKPGETPPSWRHRPRDEDLSTALARGMSSRQSEFLRTLADLDLDLQPVAGGRGLELRSGRIFLDPPVVEAALRTSSPRVILTYLVNQFRAGTNAVPYSMVTAAGAPYVPADLAEDEIILNRWLADELRVEPGASVDLTYFLADSGSQLAERTNRFRIRAIVPLEGIYADRRLMPEFPGLAKAESTHDWDAGFPLEHPIRDQDEAYWKEHRGTPKAFVSLAAGRRLWGSRFGDATAIRWDLPPGRAPVEFRATTQSNLLGTISPRDLGLSFEPVRAQAVAASVGAQDFGGLFIGFSFFLIAAALMLMGLLFQFHLEQRATEIGTLLALGFTPARVRRLLLGEGLGLALIGGLLGTAGGVAYARGMIGGLTTIWRDAIASASLGFHVTGLTLGIGVVASVAVCGLTFLVVLRRQGRRPVRELLSGGPVEDRASQGAAGVSPVEEPSLRNAMPAGASERPNDRRDAGGTLRSAGAGAALCALGALGLVGWALFKGETANAGAFFGAGALLLTSGLLAGSAWLAWLAGKASADGMTLSALGVRGCARRRSRSLTTIGLLASGSFIVVAIAAFKLDASQNAWKRGSGTGGFALIGQTALPVAQDLNTRAGREFFGLSDRDLAGVEFVPLRVRDGDDASCLNLNRAQRPRLLGVKPEMLAQRGAFTFAGAAKGLDRARGWDLLRNEPRTTNHELPAIGDANSIQWALHKKLGETIAFTDERGREFEVKLAAGVANSILQGSLLIDETEFVRRFPGESGHRMWLIDCPSNRVSEVSAILSRALQDVGLEMTPAATRLGQFNAVQNTYLNTFQVLGGLGLLLGSAGLGVVVLRNVLERRAEMGLLLAVGFRRRALEWLVLSEHAGLLGLGLGLGLGAAAVAVVPAVLTPGADFPVRSLALTLGGVLLSGGLWTWLATRVALRGEMLKALRNE